MSDEKTKRAIPPGPPDPPHRAWDGRHACPTCRARCRVLPDAGTCNCGSPISSHAAGCAKTLAAELAALKDENARMDLDHRKATLGRDASESSERAIKAELLAEHRRSLVAFEDLDACLERAGFKTTSTERTLARDGIRATKAAIAKARGGQGCSCGLSACARVPAMGSWCGRGGK